MACLSRPKVADRIGPSENLVIHHHPIRKQVRAHGAHRWSIDGSPSASDNNELKRYRVICAMNGVMRKKIVESHQARQERHSDSGWLDLEPIATVEVTSEDPGFPIENAFRSDDGPGWRASRGGEQQDRIIFDRPVPLHLIELRFHEPEFERTQEFVLRWSSGSGGSPVEIVRQQWNFSPAGATAEIERYAVDLDGVSVLELVIRPDLHRPKAVATLASRRMS